MATINGIERNRQLARILGLTRAGYNSSEIAAITYTTVNHARIEMRVALRYERQIIDMIAGHREWAHVFPSRPLGDKQ